MLKFYFNLIFTIYLTLCNWALASIILPQADSENEISRELYLGKDFSALNSNSSLNLGYFNGEKWVSVAFKNASSQPVEKIIYFNTLTGTVDLYQNETQSQKLSFIQRNGSSIPYNLRPIKSVFTAFKLNFAPLEEKKLHFLIKSRHNFNSEVFIGTMNSLYARESQKLNYLDLYAGGILCLILYNLFIFFSLQDKNYLYYCFFSLSFLLTVLNIHGKLDKSFTPLTFSFSHYLLAFSSLALMTATLFSFQFLEIKNNLKKFKIIYYALFIIPLLLMGAAFTTLEDRYPVFLGTLIDLFIVIGNLFFIVNSIQLLKVSTYARFYLFSWVALIVTLLSWFGMTFGLIPQNAFSQNALLTGNILQMLTISLALAHRIRDMIEHKKLAQEMSFERNRYQRLVRVISHDIANSLTIINSFSKRLLKTPPIDPFVVNANQKIYIAGENIKNILNNVREQELLPSRKSSLKLAPVNIKKSIEQSILIFEEQLKSKQIECTLKIDESATIMANTTCFINNIVNNIISNSIKFSRERSNIEICSEIKESELSLFFMDHGRGIRPELIEGIFFSSEIISESGIQNETGHGFGASLMREYVELFNGKLTVQSIHESTSPMQSGTTIKIVFPNPENQQSTNLGQ